MILYKNRLIFGIIKNIIVTTFKVLYKIIELLNLQVPLLFALVGLVMFLTGVFEKNPIVLTIFYVLLVVAIVSSIVATIKKLLGLDKRVKKSKGAQIVEVKTEKDIEKPEKTEKKETPKVKEDAPTYYRVKQNPNYVMAEYEDKYVLYKRTESGLKQIRTDYK